MIPLQLPSRSYRILTQFRDSRIAALINNGIQEKKRSFIIVVGDRAKDAIVYLHHIKSTKDMKQNKSVLWAYKNKLLGFTRYETMADTHIKANLCCKVTERSAKIRSRRI